MAAGQNTGMETLGSLPRPLKEVVKFGVVGSIGFVVDLSTYTLLTRLFDLRAVFCLGFGSYGTIDLSEIRSCSTPSYPVVAANMISVLLAVSSNFLLNKFWTFRDRRQNVLAAQGIAYVLMSIVTWILNQFLTGLFASRLDVLHTFFGSQVDLAAKILAIGVVMFVNFAGSKLIFRHASA